MKRTFILIVVLLAAVYISNAQTADRKWSIGIHGGFNQYAGDLGNGFYTSNHGTFGMGGLSLSCYLNRYFDLSLMGNYGNVGYTPKSFIAYPAIINRFKSTMFHVDLSARLKFLGDDDMKFSPFVLGGVGFSTYKYKTIRSDNNKKSADASLVAGFGLTYHVTKVISLQLIENFIFTSYDKVDNIRDAGPNDYYLQHSLGIAFNFGKAKDRDHDGIPDRLDKCPDVKGLAKYDGCPDTDNDGVPDNLDKCPGTPANVKVDVTGCPFDSDGDGVPDYIDKCPTVKGPANLDGCPDADNDGVADINDKCPNTPEGVKVDAKGCPLDLDGDGVADYLDKCPSTPAGVKVDANGCPPDRDGDGVPDYLDKCPDVKGTVANKGCPEVKQEVKDIFEKALQGIQFETGKDVIRPVSFKILDNVVTIMKENKEYNLNINGHTDNVGKPEANMILSQKRAEAVKAYLVMNGVEQNRLKSFGFGDTKPVADNKTPEGRAKNRRVEFVVEF